MNSIAIGLLLKKLLTELHKSDAVAVRRRVFDSLYLFELVSCDDFKFDFVLVVKVEESGKIFSDDIENVADILFVSDRL